MSKVITAEMSAHLESGNTTLSTCWRMIREDGVVLGFTDSVVDLEVSSVVYEAATGYTPSALTKNDNMAVDNMDILGLLNSDGITDADIEAKKYDNAEVFTFMVNYNDLTMGQIKMGRGRIGNITTQDEQYVAEYRSLAQLLQQPVGERYSLRCRAELGDTRCGVNLLPDVWASSTAYDIDDIVRASSYDARRYVCTASGTSSGSEPIWNTTIGSTTTDNTITWTAFDAYTHQGTVSSAPSRRHFIDTTLGKDTGFFDYGVLTWTSGNNSGYTMEIKSYVKSMAFYNFYLYENMPYSIEVGDTFTVTIGCDKDLATCRDTFDNIVNMRAEPFIPGIDKVTQFGGQT